VKCGFGSNPHYLDVAARELREPFDIRGIPGNDIVVVRRE
jgi:hypothetical protein